MNNLSTRFRQHWIAPLNTQARRQIHLIGRIAQKGQCLEDIGCYKVRQSFRSQFTVLTYNAWSPRFSSCWRLIFLPTFLKCSGSHFGYIRGNCGGLAIRVPSTLATKSSALVGILGVAICTRVDYKSSESVTAITVLKKCPLWKPAEFLLDFWYKMLTAVLLLTAA